MRCSNCGVENNETSIICSNCGTELLNNNQKRSMLKSKKLIAFSITAFAIIIIGLITILNFIIIPNQAANQMRKAFDSKNGANVINVFTKYCGEYSVVYDDLTRSGKSVYNEFKNCISDSKNDLNNQSEETDINNYLTKSMGDIALPQDYSAITTISEYNSELNTIVMDYYELYNSKISYQKAIELFNAGDFNGAILLFSQVVNDDTLYKNAQIKLTEVQKKLLEEKLSLIDGYINSGNYDSAEYEINYLRNKNLSEEINKTLDEYETKIYEARLAKIDEYVDNGDIDGAKKYIESLGSNISSDAQTRLNQALKDKADYYITKADDALKSGERQGAYDMAVIAQKLCPYDEDINNKVEYYKQYLPFNLSNYNNVLSEDYIVQKAYGVCVYYDYFSENNTISNNAQRMENNIWLILETQANKKNLFNLTYNLNKKYDSLEGTIYILQRAKNTNIEGYIEIYGDGKKIYTSPTMKKNILPQDFSINVSNVSTLVVKFYGYGDAYTGDPGYGVSNFKATKSLPNQ